MDLLDQSITTALSVIYDPCSVAAGRPTSLIDMRLVTGWAFADGVLSITFCVTFAGCTMAPHFVEAARAALAAIDGVTAVITRIDTEHVWQPTAAIAMTGVPQAWRSAQNR
jgi:metal-sulfur cluster biosynthetic enzyme